MPFQELEKILDVEIIMSGSNEWESRLRGRPLLADHWLIGDEALAGTLNSTFPDLFEKTPVRITSWLTRESLMLSNPEDALREREHQLQPEYFYFKPKSSVALATALLESFPPIRCHSCLREMPELPFDFQPIPDLHQDTPQVVALKDFCLEGYDYLFHESTIPRLERLFPEMILEKITTEPMRNGTATF